MTNSTGYDEIEFLLTPEDRDIILTQALALDDDLARWLRFGVHDGKRIRISMPLSEFDLMLDMLAAATVHAEPRSVRRKCERIYDGLARLFDNTVAPAPSPMDGLLRRLPPEVRDEVQHLLDSGKCTTMDNLNRELNKISDAHNKRPCAEFGGLSPEQVGNLLYTPFGSPESGLQLNTDLSLDDLRHAEILMNARVFLRELDVINWTATTKKLGNLNRKFVASMLEKMQWPDGFIEELWRFNKVANEEDVFPLHILRIVLEQARLIRKVSGEMRVTKQGKALCKDEAAGELFALLFTTFFGTFELSYLDRMPEHPMLQNALAYSLYRLGRDGGTWQTPEQLSEALLLPRVAQEADQSDYVNMPALLTETRILRPLGRFALVESQDGIGPSGYWKEMIQARKMPLFDKFVRFTVGK